MTRLMKSYGLKPYKAEQNQMSKIRPVSVPSFLDGFTCHTRHDSTEHMSVLFKSSGSTCCEISAKDDVICLSKMVDQRDRKSHETQRAKVSIYAGRIKFLTLAFFKEDATPD